MTEAKASFQLPFTTMSKANTRPNFTAFIYGFSGSGKTYLAKSALQHQATCPILVCMCDNGELTLFDDIEKPEMVVTQIRNIGDFNSIYAFLSRGRHPFKTVFIDNLTELHRNTINARVKEGGRSLDQYQFQDYGVVRNQILGLVSEFALKLKGVNVVFTALAANRNDELSGTTFIEPDLPGKLATEVPGYADIVGYLEVRTPTRLEQRQAQQAGATVPDKYRALIVNQTSKVPVARNRGGFLGDEVLNPTLPHILGTVVTGLQGKN